MSSRQPGQITVQPRSTLSPGEVDNIVLSELSGGPRDKKGYLRKYLPFRAALVDSYTSSVRIDASINNGDFNPVPTNSARTFDSIGVNAITIRNPSGSGADLDPSDLQLIFFTTEAQTSQEESGFSLGQLAEDIIPGVRSGVLSDR